MPKKQQSDNSKRRTKVKELPKQEKELTKDEAKKVKGGAGAYFLVDIAAKPKQ